MPAVTTQITGGIEWGQSVKTGLSISPFSGEFSSEFGTGTILYGLGSIPVEWTITSGVASKAIFPMEWTAGHNISVSQVIPISFGTRIPSPQPLALEWRGGAFNVVATAGVPLEWRSGFFKPQSTNMDWSTSRITQASAPIEWQLNIANIAAKATLPIEWRSTLVAPQAYALTPFSPDFSVDFGYGRTFTNLNIEFGATTTVKQSTPIGISATAQVRQVAPLAWQSNFNAPWVFPTAFGASLSVRSVAPIEWQVGHFSTVNAIVPIEWRSSFATQARAYFDWSIPFTLTGVSVPVAFGASVIERVTLPTEAKATSTVAGGVPIEGRASLAVSINPPVAAGASVAAKAVAPVDWLANPLSQASAIVPIEWRRNLVVQAGVPIEAATTFQGAKVSFPVAFGLSVLRSAVIPVAWQSTTLLRATAPIEWARGLKTATTISVLPIEWSGSVAAVGVFPIESIIGRDSWGAELEPDAWERANAVPPPESEV